MKSCCLKAGFQKRNQKIKCGKPKEPYKKFRLVHVNRNIHILKRLRFIFRID